MHRRDFLSRTPLCALALSSSWPSWAKEHLPYAEDEAYAPKPIPEPHFPDRLHLFVWRNWELANAGRLAQVLGTTPERVLEVGASMGLPEKPELSRDQLRRIYITVIRQNWHILPHEQLMRLLDWEPAQYEYHLKEDDFLSNKLGAKPQCDRLEYEEPSPEAKQCAGQIRRLVEEVLGSSVKERGEPPFAFVEQLSNVRPVLSRDPQDRPLENEVDLSQGWTLARPAGDSGIPLALVEEFLTYLEQAMACKVVLGAEKKRTDAKVISLSLHPALGETPGSFELSVGSEEVRIAGSDLFGLRQALCYLQDQMESREGPYLPKATIRRDATLDPRYVYSYFALYGDPLMEPDIDPFTDGLLEKLARAGVNGVWLQAVLRTLAPSDAFPEFGAGWETRVRNLNKLIERAGRYGVKVYLYLNEPRSMPAEFFACHPDVQGTRDPGDARFFAMCTSTPKVREWLAGSLAHLFSHAPGLGGIFCITASEGLTNCFSHGHAEFCPRCAGRNGSDAIAEVIQTFRDGVRRSSAQAGVIAWDWGWGDDWVRNCADPARVIQKLPHDVPLLSVSEWGKQVVRGGHRATVGEYSISVVGPGPRAMENWGMARERGIPPFAKVQWNSTWEISAVPYIPVPNLILEHCQNLLKTGVKGLMASWTVGGYPSPNFDAAKQYYYSPAPESSRVLSDVASRRYGRSAAPEITDAWRTFSIAFLEYPMGGGDILYQIPVQHGPSNLLRLHPTGYKASMVLFPYDDYERWSGHYPVEVVEKQFEKMAALWAPGVAKFRRALERVPPSKQPIARKDLGIAETCYLHFKSVANQIRFCRLRADYETATPHARPELAGHLVEIAREEIELANRQYAIAKRDSTIAFEATSHYYYRPLDLVEKVLNCHHLIDEINSSMKS